MNKKSNEKRTQESGKGNWKEFIGLLRAVHLPWGWIILAFLCNALYSEVMLLLPTTTAGLLSGSTDKGVLWGAIQFYVLFTIVLCADTALRTPAQHIATRNARRTLWDRMLHIRMDYFDRHDPSDLLSTITNDTEAAMQVLVTSMAALLPSVYYVVRALMTVSSYNVWLMVSVFLLFPVKIVYMAYIGRRRYKTQSGLYREVGGLTAYLAERVRGLGLIKTYTNEQQELENGEQASKKLFLANMKITGLECTITGMDTVISLLQNLVVMVFGVLLLQRGTITMQQWVAFFMYAGTLSSYFSSLIGYWTDLKNVQGTLARASRLVSAPVEDEMPDVVENTTGTQDITFEQVSFAYGDKQALHDVTFTVRAGSATAIVGLCGSGKTTSISLLERFYSCKDGSVRIGGQDVNQMSLDKLRGRFGYVQQGADIFSGTLRAALTYGLHRDVTDEEIWTAARRSGFDQVIHKLDGELDARVSAGGTSLSGGQRQRLVLTREFLRDADILLLDEPTSALDAAASAEVQNAIFELFPGKTKLIVTHDPTLMERADQIIVLDHGKLAGCGTYAQLSRSCRAFQELLAAGCACKEVEV